MTQPNDQAAVEQLLTDVRRICGQTRGVSDEALRAQLRSYLAELKRLDGQLVKLGGARPSAELLEADRFDNPKSATRDCARALAEARSELSRCEKERGALRVQLAQRQTLLKGKALSLLPLRVESGFPDIRDRRETLIESLAQAHGFLDSEEDEFVARLRAPGDVLVPDGVAEARALLDAASDELDALRGDWQVMRQRASVEISDQQTVTKRAQVVRKKIREATAVPGFERLQLTERVDQVLTSVMRGDSGGDEARVDFDQIAADLRSALHRSEGRRDRRESRYRLLMVTLSDMRTFCTPEELAFVEADLGHARHALDRADYDEFDQHRAAAREAFRRLRHAHQAGRDAYEALRPRFDACMVQLRDQYDYTASHEVTPPGQPRVQALVDAFNAIDTSHAYPEAEGVVGDLEELLEERRAFIATWGRNDRIGIRARRDGRVETAYDAAIAALEAKDAALEEVIALRTRADELKARWDRALKTNAHTGDLPTHEIIQQLEEVEHSADTLDEAHSRQVSALRTELATDWADAMARLDAALLRLRAVEPDGADAPVRADFADQRGLCELRFKAMLAVPDRVNAVVVVADVARVSGEAEARIREHEGELATLRDTVQQKMGLIDDLLEPLDTVVSGHAANKEQLVYFRQEMDDLRRLTTSDDVTTLTSAEWDLDRYLRVANEFATAARAGDAYIGTIRGRCDWKLVALSNRTFRYVADRKVALKAQIEELRSSAKSGINQRHEAEWSQIVEEWDDMVRADGAAAADAERFAEVRSEVKTLLSEMRDKSGMKKQRTHMTKKDSAYEPLYLSYEHRLATAKELAETDPGTALNDAHALRREVTGTSEALDVLTSDATQEVKSDVLVQLGQATEGVNEHLEVFEGAFEERYDGLKARSKRHGGGRSADLLKQAKTLSKQGNYEGATNFLDAVEGQLDAENRMKEIRGISLRSLAKAVQTWTRLVVRFENGLRDAQQVLQQEIVGGDGIEPDVADAAREATIRELTRLRGQFDGFAFSAAADTMLETEDNAARLGARETILARIDEYRDVLQNDVRIRLLATCPFEGVESDQAPVMFRQLGEIQRHALMGS